MKTSVFLAAFCCMFILSCTSLELSFPGMKTKDECRHRDNGSNDDFSNKEEIIVKDTSIFFAAVLFPESYDWVKDPSYGLAPFRLVFYKNNEVVLSIDSSSGLVSSNPDTHHIIGDNLYTEYNKDGQTIICRNGDEILRISENGTLKGILESDGDFYTLFQEKYSKRVSLRKGEKLIFSAENCEVFGDLSEPSYFPNGALYKDRESVCFCYISKQNGLCYSVKDGKERSGIAGNGNKTVLDMKVINGVNSYAYDRYGTFRLRQARIWRERPDSPVSGLLISSQAGAETPVILADADKDIFENICDESGIIYRSRTSDMVVIESNKDGLLVYDSRSGKYSEYGNSMLMSPSCALAGDAGIHLALTPRSRPESPFIISDKGRKDTDFHGYISCVTARISFPTQADGCHLPEPLYGR